MHMDWPLKEVERQLPDGLQEQLALSVTLSPGKIRFDGSLKRKALLALRFLFLCHATCRALFWSLTGLSLPGPHLRVCKGLALRTYLPANGNRFLT